MTNQATTSTRYRPVRADVVEIQSHSCLFTSIGKTIMPCDDRTGRDTGLTPSVIIDCGAYSSHFVKQPCASQFIHATRPPMSLCDAAVSSPRGPLSAHNTVDGHWRLRSALTYRHWDGDWFCIVSIVIPLLATVAGLSEYWAAIVYLGAVPTNTWP